MPQGQEFNKHSTKALEAEGYAQNNVIFIFTIKILGTFLKES